MNENEIDAMPKHDRDLYGDGYMDAVRDISTSLEKIILKAESSNEVMLDVSRMVAGFLIIMDGGTLEEAAIVSDLLGKLK